MSKKRVIILGGGFAGVYTAIHLERALRRRDDVEVTLVSKEDYLVFQPLLAEVVSGSVGILDTVIPIRRLVPLTTLYVREVESVDVAGKRVTLSPGIQPQPTVLEFDHLVIALGNVTDFRKIPGLHDHAFPFKNLGDALRLRDHLIHVLNEASIEKDPELRKQLLTFVVAGGGFSGVEVCAELNDFVRSVGESYFHMNREDMRVVLVHSHDRVLNGEMPDELGSYAQKVMAKRGVEFIFNQHLQTATPELALLQDGSRIFTRTLISTVPSSPNPVVVTIDVPKERGRIQADLKMQVQGTTNIWALGDCALIPSPTGEGYCPPTAQFAIREAAVCAHNILAAIDGRAPQEFAFRELGKMASLGHHRAIARLFNRIDLEGFLAWIFWRTVYWAKLPGFDRKLRVGASWLLDLICGAELVQTKLDAPQGMSEQHFEPGEFVVHQGDPENELFVITAGKAEAIQATSDGDTQVVQELTTGQCFGASSVLDRQTYPTSVRCVEPLTVTVYRRDELIPLLSIAEIKKTFEALSSSRKSVP